MDDKEYLAKLLLVKAAREHAEQLISQVSAERTAWNTEHQDLLKAAADAELARAQAEAQLRDLVLLDFAATARTKFDHGVQIKVFESIKYDEAKALFWAHENFKAAVKTSLDKPVFDAFAKHHPLPGLVEIVRAPKAMLPSRIIFDDQGTARQGAACPGPARQGMASSGEANEPEQSGDAPTTPSPQGGA